MKNKTNYNRSKGAGLLKRWQLVYAELHSNRTLITVSDFEEYLDYNRRTVYNFIAEGLLPPLDGRHTDKQGKPGYWKEATLAQRFSKLKAQHPEVAEEAQNGQY